MRSFDCDLYIDLMPLVKDGAASTASREALEAHMKECDACREAYATLSEGPAPEAPSDDTLKRIKKRLTAMISALLLFGTMLGASLTMTGSMGYNLLLFPIMGIIAYALRGKQCWRVALDVAVFCAIWMLICNITSLSWAVAGKILLYPLCYCLACLLGSLAAYLVHLVIRKKFLKGITGLVLLAAVLYGGSLFFGNPIGYEAVRAHADAYLEKEYPGLQLEYERIYYNWYSGGFYELSVTSPISPDSAFTLHYDRLGQLTYDGYEDRVLSGESTFSRLHDAYAALMEPLKDSLPGIVNFNLSSDWASIYDGYNAAPQPPEKIILSQLIPDHSYDIRELGSRYGNISISLDPETVTEKAMQDALLKLHSLLEQLALPARTVDITIYNDTDSLTVMYFPVEDIGAENFAELVHKACQDYAQFENDWEAWLQETYNK